MSARIYDVRYGGPQDNKYCGPGAASILTGMTTGQAEAWLRREYPRWFPANQPVKGIHLFQLRKLLETCGLELEDQPLHPIHKWLEEKWQQKSWGVRLAGWLMYTQKTRGDDVFLVTTSSHFQVIRSDTFIDNRTMVPVGLKHKKVPRRSIVCSVYRVTGKPRIPAWLKKLEEKK